MNRHPHTKDHASERRTRWIKQPAPVSRDKELAAAAVDAMECLTTVPLETIRVTASNSWLHLEGTVSQPHQRITLEEVVRNLPGVRGITDCVTVARIGA